MLEAQARVVLCCGWGGRRRLHRRCRWSRLPLQQRAPGVGLHLRHWRWQCYGAGGMGAAALVAQAALVALAARAAWWRSLRCASGAGGVGALPWWRARLLGS